MSSSVLEVLDGGSLTTVQDSPGRLGYWHVGVPPSGPMDDLSHALVNRVLGNNATAAALEITRAGPTIRLDGPAVIAVGGAPVRVEVDGESAPTWHPLEVRAGAVVRVGAVGDRGMRAVLGVRGGIDVPPFLGSRATFTLGRLGGKDGRALEAGDELSVADDVDADVGVLAAGAAPALPLTWDIGVLAGPHTEPDFLAPGGTAALIRASWHVHFNSSRTGVRLIGPKPLWARGDGGDAGLHPSNIHDTGYAFGAVDLTGDLPIILGPDGPSLGGFVCPFTVARAERWKLGQLAPGDRVRFVPWVADDAARAWEQRTEWLARVTQPIRPLARVSWNRAPRAKAVGNAVVARDDDVTIRQAGDDFVLVEFGEMTLDLELRLRVQALERWVSANLQPGLVDATAGVRSLLVHVDPARLSTGRAIDALRAAAGELDDVAAEPVPSRIVHLPLSWDDPATRLAIERYMHGVRDDAPWCPWNIEFIRRVNGLATVEDVRRIVFDASYLVLGLGDVYLGAPVATPLDPCHRLVTTKYNPARTWTPENAVGIGGAYLCIYGMEGPGGYQFVGRTIQVWNSESRGPHFEVPWLLRTFDQIRWFPVTADELLAMRQAHGRGALDLEIEETMFRPADHRSDLARHADDIAAFQQTQRAAFAAERAAWEASGELVTAGSGQR